MTTWPAPKGLGILPPHRNGIVTYNVWPIPEDIFSVTPDVVMDWYDMAEEGTPHALALLLPGMVCDMGVAA